MDISGRMNKSDALIEARRCLGCYEAPCIQACPVGVNVPGFIKRLREGNDHGATDLVYAANPLAAVCGAACPTENLCEGACTLNKMGQRPVRIGELQMFVACQCQVPEKTLVNKNAKNVAIVGSGPSGLGCAAQLRRLGYRVDIYERSNSIGGLMEKVIPAYRLPQEIVDGDINRLLQSGIRVRYETVIGKDEIGQLLDHYDAVFLGVGLSGEKISPIDGLSPQTQDGHSALAYLREARAYERGLTLSKPELGKKVVVV